MTQESWLDDERTPQMVADYKKQGVHVEEKTGWFWTTLAWLLFLVTFGSYKRDRFLKDFATTIGTKVGFPREWTYDEVTFTLPHEARHIWQGKVCGCYTSAWVGLPIFFLLYVVLPIPIGFAWFRYMFEKDATRATVRKLKADGVDIDACYRLAEHGAKNVSSSAYVWSVPEKFAVKGYRKMVSKVWMEN